jgi:hypothetical protein
MVQNPMKKLALALGLCLALGSSALSQGPMVGPGQLIPCNRIGVLPAGSTGLQQVIPPSGTVPAGQSVFICGWHVTNTGATGTFSASYGTGSNCGTGTTTVFPAVNVQNTAPSADHIDYAVIQLPFAQNLCINPSVATISAIVFYNQF